MTFFNDQKQKFLIKQTTHLVPMGQAQREVYNLTSSRNELEWLRKKVTNPVGRISDLWKQLLAQNSLPVSNSVNANRKTYFTANS